MLSLSRSELIQQLDFIDYTYSTIDTIVCLSFNGTPFAVLLKNQFNKCAFLTIRIVLLAQLIIDIL